jgi:hypothetical protein
MDAYQGNRHLYQEDVPIKFENANYPLMERNLKLVDSNRMTVVINGEPITKEMAQKLGLSLEFMAMFLNAKVYKLGEPLVPEKTESPEPPKE